MRCKMMFLATMNKDTDDEKFFEVEELRIDGDPDQLRYLAHFILREAEEIAKYGDDYGHTHLQDEWKGWKVNTKCDVIMTTLLHQAKPEPLSE